MGGIAVQRIKLDPISHAVRVLKACGCTEEQIDRHIRQLEKSEEHQRQRWHEQHTAQKQWDGGRHYITRRDFGRATQGLWG
jgi:hypothetical protein